MTTQTTAIKVWGGDTVETTDGRVGTICGTMFDIGPNGRENEYTLKFEGETEYPRFDTGPDGKYASGDRSHRAYHSEIVRVVRYGRHDYYSPKKAEIDAGRAERGHCSHCGIKKSDHTA